MKRSLLIFALLAVSALGCDLLEEEPKNLIDPDRFYRTEADATAAIGGIYAHLLNSNTFGVQMDIYFDVNTDLLAPTRVLGAGQQFMGYRWDATTERFRVIWTELYQGVNDANLVIAEVEKSDINPDVKTRTIAEARFLRGFIYYYLAAIFGDVPLITEPVTGDNFAEVGQRARAPVAEVRAQIIADAEYAETRLPSERDQYRARATRWAATNLKLKAHLWQADWAAAAAAARDLIDHSPHRLLDDYGAIFDPENELNDEVIFAIDWLFDEVDVNRHSRYTPRAQDERGIPASARPFSFNGFGFFTMYKSVANTFAAHDARRPHNVFDHVVAGADTFHTNFVYLPKMMRPDDARGNSGLNYKFFRLADVYLNLAEAENELNGPTPAAFEALNRVRARASLTPLQGLSRDDLREAIEQERIWELVGEGNHRKLDLVRWGRLGEALQERRALEEQAPNTNQSLLRNIRLTADNFQPHMALAPVPASEILLNPSLEQNPGY